MCTSQFEAYLSKALSILPQKMTKRTPTRTIKSIHNLYMNLKPILQFPYLLMIKKTFCFLVLPCMVSLWKAYVQTLSSSYATNTPLLLIQFSHNTPLMAGEKSGISSTESFTYRKNRYHLVLKFFISLSAVSCFYCWSLKRQSTKNKNSVII